MGDRREPGSQSLGRELRKIIYKGDGPGLGNQIGPFDFRNESEHRVVQSRNVNRAQPKALDNGQNEAL